MPTSPISTDSLGNSEPLQNPNSHRDTAAPGWLDLLPTVDNSASLGKGTRAGNGKRDAIAIAFLLIAVALGGLLAAADPSGQANLNATGGGSAATWFVGRLLYWFGALAWLLPFGMLAYVARWWLRGPQTVSGTTKVMPANEGDDASPTWRDRIGVAIVAAGGWYARRERSLLRIGGGAGLALLAVAGFFGDAATIHPTAPTLGGVLGLLLFDGLAGLLGDIGARAMLFVVAAGGVTLVFAPWRSAEAAEAEAEATDEANQLAAAATASPLGHPDLQPYSPPAGAPLAGDFLVHPESFSTDSGSYRLPPRDLLPAGPARSRRVQEQAEEGVGDLLMALADLEVPAELIAIECGPTVTRYTIQIDDHVPALKRRDLARDLPSTMADANVRVIDPAPSPRADEDAAASRFRPAPIAVEVPNHDREAVELRDLLADADALVQEMALPLALGRNAAGEPAVVDLAADGHLLLAGGDEGEAQPAVDLLLLGLLLRSAPESVRFALLGTGPNAFARFDGLPHLWTAATNDVPAALDQLNAIATEVADRAKQPERESAKIVVAIDEWADLSLGGGRDAQATLEAILEAGPAVGVYVLLLTQRPSLDVLPIGMRDRFPTRVALRLGSAVDSRTVLGTAGAERLLDGGDALVRRPGVTSAHALERVQLPRYDSGLLDGVLGFVRQQPGAEQPFGTMAPAPGHDTVVSMDRAAEEAVLAPEEIRGSDEAPVLPEGLPFDPMAAFGETWTPDTPGRDLSAGAADPFAAASQADPFGGGEGDAGDGDADPFAGAGDWVDAGSSVAVKDAFPADDESSSGGRYASPIGITPAATVSEERLSPLRPSKPSADRWDDLESARLPGLIPVCDSELPVVPLLEDPSLHAWAEPILDSSRTHWSEDEWDGAPGRTIDAVATGDATEDMVAPHSLGDSWGGTEWQPSAPTGLDWGGGEGESGSFVDLRALRESLAESDEVTLPTGSKSEEAFHEQLVAMGQHDGQTEPDISVPYDETMLPPPGVLSLPSATLDAAIQLACDHDGCSLAILQRHLGVTAITAALLLTHLEAHGIITPGYGRAKRALRINPDAWRSAS